MLLHRRTWGLSPLVSLLCACSGGPAEDDAAPAGSTSAAPESALVPGAEVSETTDEGTPSGDGAGPSLEEGAEDSSPANDTADGAPSPSPGSESDGPDGASPSGAPGDGNPADVAPPVSACADAIVDPGPSPLRLLTRNQYLNTLDELFGSAPDLDAVLTTRPRPRTIGAGQGDISQVEIEDTQRAAEQIALDVVSGPSFASVAPCDDGREPRDCARDFVVDFGARAYRAPIVDEDDIERHLALFDAGNATDYRHGIELVLRGMLQSGRFLYRVELGTGEPLGDFAVALSGYEVAARLAYTFWDGPPNAELTRAAAEGALSTPEGIALAAEAVLADPRGASAARRFLEALVQLDALEGAVKDEAMFPEWRADALPAELGEQARHFFDDVLADGGGRLNVLLTTPRVFANRALAPYYGVEASDDFEVFALDEGQAAGVLTLPALLAVMSKPNESSPIYRGKFVREMLLCQSPPPPPPDIPAAPEVEAGVSTRERLRQHEVDPACSTCHVLLDPIGFGFEHYDAIGRYRDSDGGMPVDARGEIVGTRELDGPFDGVRELADRLADSREVRECVALQYFRFALERAEDGADACSVERLRSAFENADASLNALPLAIVATDAFGYRRPIDTTETR